MLGLPDENGILFDRITCLNIICLLIIFRTMNTKIETASDIGNLMIDEMTSPMPMYANSHIT